MFQLLSNLWYNNPIPMSTVIELYESYVLLLQKNNFIKLILSTITIIMCFEYCLPYLF